MIIGTYLVPRTVHESHCQTATDYELSEIGDYKIYSHELMPRIEFAEADEWKESIDDSIFLNDDDTKLTINKQIEVQNYLTTKYIGRAPLEFYGPKTKRGRQFILMCEDCNPDYDFRVFGTDDAIKTFNRNANENIKLPK